MAKALPLETHGTRLMAANALRTVAVLAVLLVAVAVLAWGFGRTGERIALLMCVNVAAVVSLTVYCGNTGIVSFGHGAFITVGAYLSGILTMPAGLQRSALPDLPLWLAAHELTVLGAMPFVALGGLAMALLTGSAIARLVGASATIATLGLLIIVHSIAVSAREITRGSQTFYGVPRLTDLLFTLIAAVVFILIARAYRESRWGLFARAARDDEDAATVLGIAPRRTRLIAWVLSGAMATVAGALYGQMLGAFSPASFYLGLVFAQVVMMIVGGMASVGGAVVGVVAVTLLQNSVRNLEGGATLLGVPLPEVFGLTTVTLGLAILLVIWLRPQGIVGGFELGPGADNSLLRRVKRKKKPADPPAPVGDTKLVAQGLSKKFAGVRAVDDVSFEAPSGQITGLIGPNGAGKSTLVNLMTRQYDVDTGTAEIGGADLTQQPPHGVIRHGVARSFQNLRLFSGLTAYENVLVAALAAGRGRAQAHAIALRELSAFDLREIAGMRAEHLPYGARKRLEVARALAQEPRILLLDEPAAGMDPSETDDLADRLERTLRDRNIGILLIDHDLKFVDRLSARIVVMNRGRKIAEGTPEEIRADARVIEAYIGRGRSARAAGPNSKSKDRPNPKEGVSA